MRSEQYTANYATTVETVSYIIEHPIKASMKHYLPTFIASRTQGTRNTTVFELMTHLCKMGLHEHIPLLHQVLQPSAALREQDKLGAFLEYNYQIFDQVSRREDSEEHQKSLKALKKLIHQFARENDFPRRLFNLQKLKQKLEKQKNDYPDVQKEYIKTKAEYAASLSKSRNGRSKKSIALLEKLQEQDGWFKDYNKDEIVRKLRKLAELQENNRAYAYIRDQTIKPVTTKAERASRKRAKFWLNVVSFMVSLIVGIGEGMVAAVFAAVAWPLLLAILVVGIPAFLCNYYLFRGDSFEILKDIYFGRIWTKPNGEPLSKLEKGFVGISLIFSLGAACAFGFLSFGSGMTGFAAIFVAVGLASNPIGLMILAGLIALVTTVALFTVFAYMTVNFVRTGGPAKLKNKILNCKSNFIKFWVHENWKHLSLSKKIGHVIHKSITAFFKVLFFAVAVAAVVLVNVATTGLFKHHAAMIFHTIFKLATPISNILSYIIVVGIGGVVNSIFYGKSVMTVANVVKNGVIALAKAVLHPQQTWKSMEAGWKSMKANRVRTFHSIVAVVKKMFLFGCVAMNSYGQGSGVRRDAVALNWTHHILPVSQGADGVVNMLALAAGSGGANAMACHNATQLPAEVGDIDLAAHRSGSASSPAFHNNSSKLSRPMSRAAPNNPYRLTSTRSGTPRQRHAVQSGTTDEGEHSLDFSREFS